MSDSELPAAARDVRLSNARGLHARASAKFVRLAGDYDAEITVEKDGLSVCGTSIMGLMLLAAARGDRLTISARGRQAEEALDALAKLVNGRFEEDT